MYENLAKIWNLANRILANAPEEEGCTGCENEIYADLTNARQSIVSLSESQGGWNLKVLLPWITEEWFREDLEDALIDAGIPVNKKSVQLMLEESRGIFDDKSKRNDMLRLKAEDLCKEGKFHRYEEDESTEADKESSGLSSMCSTSAYASQSEKMLDLYRLYDVTQEILEYAPAEEDLLYLENEVLADLANLKQSLNGLFEKIGVTPEDWLPWYTEQWYREDLIYVLGELDIPATEYNLSIMIEACCGTLDDKSDRNDMLRMKVDDLCKEGKFVSCINFPDEDYNTIAENGLRHHYCTLRQKVKHVVGLDNCNLGSRLYSRHGKRYYKPYRNYFTGFDRELQSLVAVGLMEYSDEFAAEGQPINECRTYYFNRKGLDWLGNKLGITIKDPED